MEQINVICEPLSSGVSVQFELIKLIVKSLEGKFKIVLISPYIPNYTIQKLIKSTGSQVISLSSDRLLLKNVYRLTENNEAVLWAFSWLFEAFFKSNSSNFHYRCKGLSPNPTLNLAYTVPVKSLIYWNQATPPLVTLQMMKSNFLAKPIARFLGPLIEILDRKLRQRHRELSQIVIHNSNYLSELYRGDALSSGIVIHTPKEFIPYKYKEEKRSKDYVLAYIGKEIEIDVLLKIANQGVKIVSFGSKIPYGTPINKLKEKLGFMGYVDDRKLEGLYRNALFTAFPFTEEPFGWVPLESMYQGTPVLSYNKQGPSETIIDGVTGWLVGNKEEFTKKAIELWNSKELGISHEKCVYRAMSYSLESTKEKLLSVLNNAGSG